MKEIFSIQGKRPYQEDFTAYSEIIINQQKEYIAFICDGHGGKQVAHDTSLVLKNLFEKFLPMIKSYKGVEVAVQIRRLILHWGKIVFDKFREAGSTLTGLVTLQGNVYIFNVGDSKTCIHTRSNTNLYFLHPQFDLRGNLTSSVQVELVPTVQNFFCTPSHNSKHPEELVRIRNKGGIIIDNRLNGILLLTRALGDANVNAGIDYTPDVYWLKKSEVEGSIVMYSDGVYDFWNKTPNVGTHHEFYHIADESGCESLINYAYNKGSEDNITAMKIWWK